MVLTTGVRFLFQLFCFETITDILLAIPDQDSDETEPDSKKRKKVKTMRKCPSKKPKVRSIFVAPERPCRKEKGGSEHLDTLT